MATVSRTLGKRERTSSNLQPSICKLPNDILIKILCRLPCKTILQCKQVCKEWYHTILDPHFAEAHYNPTTLSLSLVTHQAMSSFNQDDSIYLIEGYKTQRRRKKQQQDYKLESLRFRVGDFINYLQFEVMNSCRGFLLIKTKDYSDSVGEVGFDLHVYNPLTNEHLKLPRVVDKPLEYTWTTMLSLVFGPVTKQYKVVRLVSAKDTQEVHLQMHTVGTDVWRRVDINKGSCNLQFKLFPSELARQFLALNGVLHWIATWQKIACFNVDEEEFNVMDSPCLENSGKYIVSIGMVHGLFCLGIIAIGNARNGVEMWVMREYGVTESWTKYLVLKDDNIGKTLPKFSNPKLVEVSDNGEIILQPQYPDYQLVLYNQKEELRSRRLRIRGFDKTMKAEIYVPSFFSIGSQVH